MKCNYVGFPIFNINLYSNIYIMYVYYIINMLISNAFIIMLKSNVNTCNVRYCSLMNYSKGKQEIFLMVKITFNSQCIISQTTDKAYIGKYSS
jgi:hypothetical protein